MRGGVISKNQATPHYSYQILNNNPYKIKAIYHNQSTLPSSEIDYIIFLDSDDYWQDCCLKECIDSMSRARWECDIVWFNCERLYDGVEKPKIEAKDFIENYGFRDGDIITPLQWLMRVEEIGEKWFAGVCMYMINFAYLQNIGLRFNDGVIHEEHNFGTLLNAQARCFYINSKRLYVYRKRVNSITSPIANNPPGEYILAIYHAFNCNIKESKKYHWISSWALNTFEMIDFLNKNPNQEINGFIIRNFLQTYYDISLTLLYARKDPLNILARFCLLKPYMKFIRIKRLDFRLIVHLALCYPKVYFAIKPLIVRYFSIRERVARAVKRIRM